MTLTEVFGRLEMMPGRAKRWKFYDLAPHVAISLKRMFPRIPQVSAQPEMTDSDDVRADLLWFMARYPLQCDRMADLEAGAARVTARQVRRNAILLPDYVPGEIRGFRPGKPPYPYQVQAGDLAMAQGGLLLGDDVGIGKTNTAAYVMAQMTHLRFGVVVQSHLTNQWKRKLEEFTTLRVHVIRTSIPYNLPPADVYVFSYTMIRGWSDYLKDGFLGGVIYDEIQELRAGTSTEKGKAAAIISGNAQFRMGLTATPIYNYGDEIHAVMSFLNPDLLGDDFEFRLQWCTGKTVKEPDALGSYLRSTGWFLRRDEDDPAVQKAMPKPNRISMKVPWDSGAAAAEAAIARALALSVTTGSFAERGRAARELDMRMRHMTGVAKARGVAEYVRMLLQEEEKVLLAGWHRDVYETWRDALREFYPVMYTGSESKAQKDRNAETFAKGASRVMIISLRSGAGLDGLQHACKTIVLGELDWSPQVHHQLEGRLRRPGQLHQIEAHYLTADNGSDPVLIEMLGLKSDQSRGLNDPGVAHKQVEVDETRIKRLAQYVLENNPAEACEGAQEPKLTRASEVLQMLQIFHGTTAGKCRWCGDVVADGKGSTAGGRLMHYDCRQIFDLHIHPEIQREHLTKLHGPGCTECGSIDGVEPDYIRSLDEQADMPDILDRLDLYGPDNLHLRCPAHRAGG